MTEQERPKPVVIRNYLERLNAEDETLKEELQKVQEQHAKAQRIRERVEKSLK